MDFLVHIGNEEENELADIISITGTVNKVECATLVRISQLKLLSPQDCQRAKEVALIKAFLAKQKAPTAKAAGRLVSYEP